MEMFDVSPGGALIVLLGLADIAYLCLAIWRVARFSGIDRAAPAFLPPLSVLKPLCGDEPGLYRCLRSFCAQDYPDFQIVFGVREADDPAVRVVERLIREFPERDLSLVVDPRVYGPNLKISNLMNMIGHCRHDVLIIADSDAEIRPDCLTRVVAPLVDREVGAVTCMYKGAATRGIVSRLGALYINDWVLPSVLVDVAMNGTDGCFGPLTVLRRRALDDAGGFAALVDYLADDHRLGQLVRRAGWSLRLSDTVVDTMVGETSLEALSAHEIRWARTVRVCRAQDHALSVVTFPLPILLALMAFAPSQLTVGLVAIHLSLRLALHGLVHWRIRPSARWSAWLVPFREIQCFAVWLISMVSDEVRWRERDFRVAPDGRLAPVGRLPDPAAGARPQAAVLSEPGE